MDIPEEFRDKRPQAEKEKSTASRYWMHAVEYGLHYFLAGRYSMFARLTPTCGNQMHHAVELLLKACLARNDTWQQILRYGYRESYGHDLEKLWAEFKKRNPDPALAAHDDVIKGLNKFEDIRYPEDLIQGGAMLSVGLYEIPPEHRTAPVATPDGPLFTPEERRFYLELPRVDRLVQTLFKASDYNPEVLSFVREPHAVGYHWLHNAAPLLPKPTPEATVAQGPHPQQV
jgi:hypothetical protein